MSEEVGGASPDVHGKESLSKGAKTDGDTQK